jgi:RNA polymerase sigma-70 factor (ECF subfamily)
MSLQTENELTDDELVAAVTAGDETAFELLFNRHRLQVGRAAGRFFHRREQVEEIVQDAFTKAYFALKDYTGGRENSFIAWLTRITINTCYDELRRVKRQAEIVDSELSGEDASSWLESNLRAADSSTGVEAKLISRDFADKLLSRLKPDDRFVLAMLSGEELSVTEIATMTGWSESKVKSRAHRARNALRATLRKLL